MTLCKAGDGRMAILSLLFYKDKTYRQRKDGEDTLRTGECYAACTDTAF